MKTKALLLGTAILLLLGCTAKTAKDKKLQAVLDSIETANSQAIVEAGDNITKAYVSEIDSLIGLTAYMKQDHRFYGYKSANKEATKLILFSIFTNDVDGNPFQMPLGSYYDTNELDDFSLKYLGEEGDFVKAEVVGKNSFVFFDKKWIVVTRDDSDNDELDLVREYGQIQKVEEIGYPMFSVSMEFVERQMKVDFTLNIEALPLSDAELVKLKGKYATIFYASDFEYSLIDLHCKGKSLQGKYAPEFDNSWEKFTGILSKATHLSGDLPSKISITNQEGQTKTFEYFVDDETMKANGQQVTAYYYSKVKNEIRKIEPSNN